MTAEQVYIVLKPAYGKNAGDLSQHLSAIEEIIRKAGGYDFSLHPHDSAAFRFILGGDASQIEAERIVQALNRLSDDDGHPLVDAEQMPLTQTREKQRIHNYSPSIRGVN